MTKKIKLCILPGDGIGVTVIKSVLPVFDLLGVPIEFVFGEIGWNCWLEHGNPVPAETWDLIHNADATLLGAITSKPEREALAELPKNLRDTNPQYKSPVIQLRQSLELFANIRPVYDIKSSKKNFNFCIIRENTEGLYAGFDYHPIDHNLKELLDNSNSKFSSLSKEQISCSLRLQTKPGMERLFKFAFEYANNHGHTRVTLADKPNVLRKSGNFAREIFEDISESYPDIQADIHNVDAVALWMVRKPEQFGVIVSENMFGDILSDLGAGIMGGLGFAPSGNIGDKGCYFEPVHGSAPRVSGDKPNPSAMFLTVNLLLDHFGFSAEANRIYQAVKKVVKSGENVTYDLGGDATTNGMTNAIFEQIKRPREIKRISILSTGSEIVNGDINETNGYKFSKLLSESGGNIYQHVHCSDSKKEINLALDYLYQGSDAVIATGGLGSTSDDQTRYAVAQQFDDELTFRQEAWNHISARLSSFGLNVDMSNKSQALFPRNSKLILNSNGTAMGCEINDRERLLFMLPGPPMECVSMFENYVLPKLETEGYLSLQKILRWQLLGILESSETIRQLERIVSSTNLKLGYRWHYPYLEVKLTSDDHSFCQETIDRLSCLLSPYCVSKSELLAVEKLEEQMKKFNGQIYLNDLLTHGNFKKIIENEKLLFSNLSSDQVKINFSANGMPKNIDSFSGQLNFSVKGSVLGTEVYSHSMAVPNRGPEVHDFAVQYLSWQLNDFITHLRREL